MSQPNHLPPKKPDKKILFLAGSLLLFLLIGIAGSRYLRAVINRAVPPPLSETSADSPATTPGETEVPEAVPEEDAPITPAPGFTDDFQTGLSPAWTVHYGDPVITHGQLTSNVGAGLAAGDPSWENYQIDFEVDTSQVDCPLLDTSNSVGVRVKDFDHAYWFVFTNCTAGWSLFAGGVDQGTPSLLPDTEVTLSKGKKHITIKVDETKMSAYENGSLISALTDPNIHSGGIFLQVEAQTFYDNFAVKLLP